MVRRYHMEIRSHSGRRDLDKNERFALDILKQDFDKLQEKYPFLIQIRIHEERNYAFSFTSLIAVWSFPQCHVSLGGVG